MKPKDSHFVSCFLHGSIIDDMFSLCSFCPDYSCNTYIEVSDDILTYLMRDSPNFLTDVGLQGLNGLSLVVIHSFLQGTPTGSSVRGEDQESGQAIGCPCAVRWAYFQESTVHCTVYCIRSIGVKIQCFVVAIPENSLLFWKS